MSSTGSLIKTTADALQAEINLGSFDCSENKTVLFQIKNTGEFSLVITNAVTTYGCAQPFC